MCSALGISTVHSAMGPPNSFPAERAARASNLPLRHGQALGDRFPLHRLSNPNRGGRFLRWKIQALELSCRIFSVKRLQSEIGWVKYDVQPGCCRSRALEKEMEGLGKPRCIEGQAERDTTPIDLTPAAMLGGGARRVSLLARPERRNPPSS